MGDSERFWEMIDRSGGCWLWLGYRTPDGHGQFKMRGRVILAHRAALLLSGVTPGPGFVVRHLCNSPGCVRPEHLRPGTQQENVADRVAAGRSARGSSHGRAKLDEAGFLHVWALLSIGVSLARVAEIMGVSAKAIRLLRDGKNWSHLRVIRFGL